MEQNAEVQTRFPSKRDNWIVVIIWVGVVMCLVGGVSQLNSAAGTVTRGLVLVALLAAAAFMLSVLYATSYSFSEETLHIRSGPFRFRVPLVEVDSVVPSRNPLSSPACSLDRLLITYHESRRRILISPEDKLGFLRALAARATHLVLQDERLSRRGSA